MTVMGKNRSKEPSKGSKREIIFTITFIPLLGFIWNRYPY